MPTNDKNGKQVMDVARPNKTPADASARPIIVGHKPLVQDPMVSSAEDKIPDEEETKTLAPSVTKKVITPPSEENSVDEKPEKSDEEPTEKLEPANSEESSTSNESSESAIVDAVVDQASATKRKENQESEEERKRKEELEKLVVEKKYFVQIRKHRRRKNSRTIIATFLALLILGGGGFMLAVDAGLINGVKAPFDLIKDTPSSTESPVEAQPATSKNPLIKIAVPASLSTKSYTDTAKIYSLTYPDHWTANVVTQGSESPLPNPALVSRTVSFNYPNDKSGTGVQVQADSKGELKKSIEQNWADNKHTPKDVTVNGNQAKYVQVVFRGDAERYTDEQYLISKGADTVFITFRVKYFHTEPPENWDASAALPGFESILNSVRFL